MPEDDICRYHLVLIDKRMPGLINFNLALIVYFRQGCLHFISKVALGENNVQLDKYIVAVNNPAGE